MFFINYSQLTALIDLCLKPAQPLSPEHRSDYIQAWQSVHPLVDMHVEPTIEGALNLARQIGNQNGNGTQTLITGSLYLVGGALSILQPSNQGKSYRTS